MNIFSKFSVRAAALATLGVAGAAGAALGRAPENAIGSQNRQILLKTAAGCTSPQAAIDLDINNVRARIMTAGNQWYDVGTGTARYEIPKGSRKNSLYAGALWVGGFDTQGQLKVTAQTYRSQGKNDYWTGPLGDNNNIDAATCNLWDRFWKVNASDILRFRELARQFPNPTDLENALSDPAFDVIKEWPARGSITAKGTNNAPINTLATTTRNYAPFVDVDGDGKYDFSRGDYPDINGDQYIWRVYNDMGNTKTQTGTLGIGIEIQASVFAYSTKDYLNDASFYNYRLINRGNLTLDSCFTATWTDADLGYAFDDYIGSDTARGLGILYNATAVDGNGAVDHYGNDVPMVGIDFFIGPTKFTKSAITGDDTSFRLRKALFTYFSNTGAGVPDNLTDPDNGTEFYRYMSGSNKGGQPFTNDFTNTCGAKSTATGSGPKTVSVYSGDLAITPSWTECCANNPPGDRRFVHSAGPFRLTGGGVTNDITIGACWAASTGGCGTGNFNKIRLADDAIQELFDNNFRTIEGPEAPTMTIREMDGKLLFYLTNQSNSNNYQEKFGYDLTDPKFRVSTQKTREFGNGDSLYKFEGYRVFQLKNRNITAAQIFGENGKVDQNVAVEVFQTDVKNGIKQLVNYAPNLDVQGGGSYNSAVKVNGSDGGIKHSFVVTGDAFAAGNEKNLINYKTYYFIAIAYASNNFKQFNAGNLRETQDRQYLESGKGQGGVPIPIYSAMPNPANGDMGTVLNSDFGSGVKITRVEGTGNGGNALQLTPESEDSAFRSSSYQVQYPVYTEASGPVTVKVVDPLKVVEADWELSVYGRINPTLAARGILPDSGRWVLTMSNGSTPVTIYSERNIRTINEQILTQYGLSVSLGQVALPGEDPAGGNNGLITSDVTFADPAQTWLTGVPDGEGASYLNWIRSGSEGANIAFNATSDWVYTSGQQTVSYDPSQVYEKLLSNNSLTTGTWAPYMLTANRDSLNNAMMPRDIVGPSTVSLGLLPSVDVVFTSDTSKWTRCVVVETSSDTGLAQGGAAKFSLRAHAGWNKEDVDANGNVTYNGRAGMSWFPGYAINQETGERLNLFFGEDSYLKTDNGQDMLWNPTSTLLSGTGTPVFGGKHFVWVTNTKYDGCEDIYANLTSGSPLAKTVVYTRPVWAGMPMARANSLRSAAQGFIPTNTRLRFRVTRPYNRYVVAGRDTVNNGYPLYRFSTKGLGPKALSDASNTSDKQHLLDLISVVPNPYFGRASGGGYEANRLDTRVRIINLPRAAEVSIYSIDGSMVRRLTKDNVNVSYIDWDLRNTKGLPVASGMYLMHVRADGIGETILRFFGATRVLDVTNY